MLNLSIEQLFVISGLIFILAELFVGIEAGFDLVAIGSALILGGFSGIITGSLNVALIVTTILALGYIMFGRTKIKEKIVVVTHNTNIDKLVGQKAVVIRSITPDTAGMVRIDDEDWRATSDSVHYEKDKVIVKGIKGVSLIVK